MTKLFIEDLPLKGKKVLMRVDFNVPLDGDGKVIDATRIEAALPSIRYILEQGGGLILMSHLGRPNHARHPELSLAPVADVLSGLLDRPVQLAPDCVGSATTTLASKLQPGDILLLENLRFHRAEEYPDEDPTFATALAALADFYVNDAFGTAHRRHSSTTTIAAHFPGKAAAGYLLRKEITFLGDTLHNPKRPFVALLGGSKVSTKLGVLKALVTKVDRLLIGGGMAYTFLRAQNISTGDSPVEEDLIPVATEILHQAKELLLPTDLVVAPACSADASPTTIQTASGIPDGLQGLDIGPQTVSTFSHAFQDAATLLWNGPVGVYEFPPFAKGTQALAHAFAASPATTIAGGGDLIAALTTAHLTANVTHLSTGGGATLEYIEHGTLPAIDALSDKP